MMYFLDYAMYQGALEAAQEELERGRKFTKKELIERAKEGGIRLSRKKVEAATDYTGHHERLCERADDLGLLHACNDTWLEVRTWNNDIRGVMTLFALAAYWMFWGMATVPDWIAVIRLHQTGLWFDRPLLATTTRLELQLSTIGITAMAAAATWAMHRYLLRYEWPTQRWIRLRFNRKTRKVYLLRPKYAGGLMVFDWTDTQPDFPQDKGVDAPYLYWAFLGWRGKELGQPLVSQFIGRRTSFKTTGDWMAFWEYIRRYMEEGPDSVPKPKTVIGHRPSIREAWISVTQWYPAFQQKGAIGKISDGITLLILPLIVLMFVGNFLGQCLTWQARFPKEIERAGRGD